MLTISAAYSTSGQITGPWVQEIEPLLRTNGGHGMLFLDKEERWILSMHEPNTPAMERTAFYDVIEIDGKLEIKGRY